MGYQRAVCADDLLFIHGGLPEGKEECAERAIAAVQDAFVRQSAIGSRGRGVGDRKPAEVHTVGFKPGGPQFTEGAGLVSARAANTHAAAN